LYVYILVCTSLLNVNDWVKIVIRARVFVFASVFKCF
jgi:hypothetical protein